MERCGHLQHICVLCSAFTGDNRCLYRHLYYGQEEFERTQKAFFEKGNFNSLREGSPVRVFGRLLSAVLYVIDDRVGEMGVGLRAKQSESPFPVIFLLYLQRSI